MRRQKSPLCCRLAYGAKFSKINPCGHISDIEGIFLAHIMFMVHIPFKGGLELGKTCLYNTCTLPYSV